ncbi:MAG: 23S rRNA (adenine(2503)-C(2))-methyltransferase RlmN, partial [Hyphomicrobium sp.]|nr:23S rRNA (adenine(2503)-C(2))-methyltransferase RlmN [Hyphomicrobium sp.]
MVLVLDSTPAPENTAQTAFPAAPRPTLAGLDRAGLSAALAAIGVPERQRRMRVGQLWTWLYAHGVTSFDAMTDISKDLRGQLAAAYSLDRPEIVTEQISTDGTR